MSEYKMNIYLAARFSQKEEMKSVAEQLRRLDFDVTAHWLEEVWPPGTTLDELSDDEKCSTAFQDLEDIEESDLVILFTVDPTTPTVRGGRHFESGYAIALGLPLWLVGPRENIFHWLTGVRQLDNINDCIEALIFWRSNLQGYVTISTIKKSARGKKYAMGV